MTPKKTGWLPAGESRWVSTSMKDSLKSKWAMVGAWSVAPAPKSAKWVAGSIPGVDKAGAMASKKMGSMVEKRATYTPKAGVINSRKNSFKGIK